MTTGPLAQDQLNFVRTSTFFRFHLELYKNKFKNLIRTSKFEFSFRGLLKYLFFITYLINFQYWYITTTYSRC